MPSPDATPYVDLTLFDKDAQDVFEAALINLQTYLSDWVPREGNTEVLLLEALALEVEETIFAINRVPGAVVEVLLRLYGIERNFGAPATATFTFTVTNTNGYTLPAGIRIALPLSADESLVFTTDVPLMIPVGSLTGTVAATATVNSSAANGTLAGSPVTLLDSVAVVETVALASTVGSGADVEDDLSWFTRGIQRFSRLAETLVLPRHFVAAALERPEVQRAYAVDNYNPTAGSGAPGSHPGHVAVAVYGVSAALSTAQKDAIDADFEDRAQANLAVWVVDPTITAVNVTATVVGVVGYTVAQVQANCSAALSAYLSPDQWPWSATVYRNELIALLDRVEGVERVTSISVPASDLALSGVAPLASPGTMSITVTGI